MLSWRKWLSILGQFLGIHFAVWLSLGFDKHHVLGLFRHERQLDWDT